MASTKWPLLFLLASAFNVLSQGSEWQLEERAVGTFGALDPGLEEIFVGKSAGGSLDARSLFERQLTCRPPTPVNCGNGCCRAGQTCCPTTCCPIGTSGTCCPVSMGGCCPNTANCVPSRNGCCSKNAQTCGGNSCWEPGAVCCNGGANACKPGESCCGPSCCAAGTTCCEGKGCCSRGEKCCPGTCCPSGWECGGRYGYCSRQTTSRTTQTTTSTIRATPPPTRTTPKVTTPKISTEKVTSMTASSSTGCRTATALPQATSANLPVMTFVYVSGGIADDIPINICLGIRHKLGFSSNSMVLTYAGDGRRCTRRRGRASGCSGCCRGVRKPSSSPNAGDGTECDEFPFKSTVEGGNGAWIRCVTNWQNQLQGYYLNSWYNNNNIKPGDRFIVEVTNLDCSSVQSTQLQSCGGAIVRPRQIELPVASGSETTVRRTLDNRTNVVVAPFGDLDGGTFEATARMLDGRLGGARLTDSDGVEIGELVDFENLYDEAGLSMTWNLDDYVGGIGFIGEAESTSVNLTWELVEQSSTTTTTTTTTPTTGAGSRAIRSASFVFLVVAGVLSSAYVFF